MGKLNFEGKVLKNSYPKKDAYNALQMPVYNNAAYEFETAEEMEAAFVGKSNDYTYSRVSNPTVQYFESKIMNITGALSVTALNSGMAAISNSIISLAYSGANIVTSRHLFGNTYSFFNVTLKAFGVEVRFCDLNDIEEVKKNIDKNTCAVFLEIISNPQMEVIDLRALSKITKDKNVPLIADTTIIPFCAFNAKDFGINIEVISSTKYISGGATSLGGLIVDYGNVDWSQSVKLKDLAKEVGFSAFTFKLKKEIHRNLGAYMTPQVAHLQTVGLETLSLRYKRAAETCLNLASELEKLDGIKFVNYTGLKNNKFHDISIQQFGKYPGAMLTFELKSRSACFAFLNKLQVIKRATNLFDNKSLAIHPESTIFGSFSPSEKEKMNINPNTIRLSVGLEDMEYLLNDIKQSLK